MVNSNILPEESAAARVTSRATIPSMEESILAELKLYLEHYVATKAMKSFNQDPTQSLISYYRKHAASFAHHLREAGCHMMAKLVMDKID
jgi:hypothetical protein